MVIFSFPLCFVLSFHLPPFSMHRVTLFQTHLAFSPFYVSLSSLAFIFPGSFLGLHIAWTPLPPSPRSSPISCIHTRSPRISLVCLFSFLQDIGNLGAHGTHNCNSIFTDQPPSDCDSDFDIQLNLEAGTTGDNTENGIDMFATSTGGNDNLTRKLSTTSPLSASQPRSTTCPRQIPFPEVCEQCDFSVFLSLVACFMMDEPRRAQMCGWQYVQSGNDGR